MYFQKVQISAVSSEHVETVAMMTAMSLISANGITKSVSQKVKIVAAHVKSVEKTTAMSLISVGLDIQNHIFMSVCPEKVAVLTKYCDMRQGCIRDERCKWTPEKGCSTKRSEGELGGKVGMMSISKK